MPRQLPEKPRCARRPPIYEGALRATIEAGGPDRERLDYQLLANLLATLEKQEPGQPPKLDAIH
jgi:hypothetical protein